jgi:glycosyltransferase involved in cell wall biosynthesis
MKITYATTYDAADVNNWSGTGHYVAQTLQKQDFELDFVGPLPRPVGLWPVFKAKGLLYNRLLKTRYHANHDLAVARHYARLIDERLMQTPDTDIVFSPGTIPIAFLKTQKPTVFWSDATHAALFDFYPEYSRLCAETIRDGHTIERRAMERASAAIFTSEWAAISAARDYGIDPAKIHVVPYGANLDDAPTASDVQAMIASRPRDRCKLLFIGVDWQRKGGDLALKVAERLNRLGLPTELTVVGCEPFTREPAPSFVRCEGFLSKRLASHRARINQLLAESHFLIVPSLAECYGLVYCEANAFGVPCLARSVGGVPTVVRNGQNGFLFDLDASDTAYAQTIERLFHDYANYRTLAHTAHDEFTSRLNWDVAGTRVREILTRIVDSQPVAAGRAQTQTI